MGSGARKRSWIRELTTGPGGLEEAKTDSLGASLPFTWSTGLVLLTFLYNIMSVFDLVHYLN